MNTVQSNATATADKKTNLKRRRFLKAGAAIGAAASLCTRSISARGRVERPTVLGIGAGGRGRADLEQVSKAGMDVVALCDVFDIRKFANVTNKRLKGLVSVRDAYSGATFGTDYRQMLAELDDKIDAVVISTPDHHHFHAAMQSMLAGKHVYCQKPLTHGIWEARMLAETARKTGVVTQMGNQAHANDHMRRCVELIRAGVVGKVKEIHAWTNRPIWPQGFASPPPAESVPAGVDWKQWIGPAPATPYSSKIAPFAWRGWWDYGTGALGDMACHIMDVGFWSMSEDGKPATPRKVIAQQRGATDFSPPINSQITWDFPTCAFSAEDGFKFFWYDGFVKGQFDQDSWTLDRGGKEYNHPSSEVLDGMDFEKFGSVIIGEEGKLFFNRSRPDWQLRTGSRIENFTWPEETLPRAGGENYGEWHDAIVGKIPRCQSNFSLAGPMTEAILLGVLAQRNSDQPLKWDAEKLQIVGRPELNARIRREYADGWDTKQAFGV